MNEGTKLLDILQVAIPADTPLTISAEVKILELIGIVKQPQLLTAMQLVSALVPPSTPATLRGLVQMLGSLMRMSTKATVSHHRSISAIMSQLDAIPDTSLTFGTFLSVCQTLVESSSKTHTVDHEKDDPKGR
jgi:hypothetical protein